MRFGTTVALDGIDLQIAAGEIFFLLGPSGCGKTTLLRSIAGFNEPCEGVIRFGDEEVTRLPAHERQTGMVFQNYALWPHKSVAENVAFGLEERKLSREEVAQRVAEALEAVRMTAYAGRRIHELSGGQQQRVALARALVIRPRCLLLDEPLSNLDAKLRLEMRTEIRRICKEAGLTAIYVTHDQKEALSIADRIAVMEGGKIRQIGAPEEIYRKPVSKFVAGFMGETNFFDAEVVDARRGAIVGTIAGRRFRAATPPLDPPACAAGDQVTFSIRPEAWRFSPGASGSEMNTLKATITDTVYLGELAQHTLETPLGTVRMLEINPRPLVGEGERERVISIAPDDVAILRE